MTIQEMHRAVDQGLQKVASSVYDYFLPQEVDFWLNRAQDRYIKERLHPVSDPKRLGFSKTVKRLDDLRMLITADYTDSVNPSTTAEFIDFDLPIDYQHLVNARVSVRIDTCGTAPTASSTLVTRELRIGEQDKFYAQQHNPFAKSSKDYPTAIIFDEEVRVFQEPEKFILETLTLDYLRIPVQMELSSSVNCELADHTHHEIVDVAVKNIIEAIESPRYQTTSIEQQKSE
tara:strand:+ start:1228 stop:1920 length:693 start_codon:yes stop_codon:yes gene_type:complete